MTVNRWRLMKRQARPEPISALVSFCHLHRPSTLRRTYLIETRDFGNPLTGAATPSPVAWNALKLTSIVLDMVTPAIAILGMFAVSGELKRSGQEVEGGNLSNG